MIEIEKFQIVYLKQIQRLPIRSSNQATQALLGIAPITSILQKNLLNLIYGIITRPQSIEFRVLYRQLAVKDVSEKSIFSTLRQVLHTYNLPTVYQILDLTPSKAKWKDMLRTAINSKTEADWSIEVNSKPSLKYLNPLSLKVGKAHHVYSTVRTDIFDVQRAEIKAPLLTGTYILQSNHSNFNQYEVDPTCKMCENRPETRQHFISECLKSKHLRDKFNIKTAKLFNINPDILTNIDRHTYTQLILDCTHPEVTGNLIIKNAIISDLELYTRELKNYSHFMQTGL